MPAPKSGGPIIKWTYKEDAALVQAMAEDHIRLAAPISTRHVWELATQCRDRGWRPKVHGVTFPSTYKDWLTKHREAIESKVQELREQGLRNAAEQPKTQAEPVTALLAPPIPEPPAPPAEQAPEVPTLPGTNMTLGQFIDVAMRQQMEEALAHQARDITLALSNVLSESFKSIPGFDAGRFLSRPDPQRKRVVLLANADPQQLESVRREFPFLEVHGMDRVIPPDLQPDLVVGINVFGTDNLDRVLRKRFGKTYSPAFGGVDSAKRVISARLVDPRLVPKRERVGLNHH